MIRYHADGVGMPKLARLINRQWIKMVCEKYGRRPGDISYIFVDDDTITSLNQEFLKRDGPTDIITFDYCEGDVISGDIFISLDTVRINATRFSQTMAQEIDRVMIHGILHLCGINDLTGEEKKQMKKEEDKALMMKSAIYAAKTLIRTYKEETQKYYDRYYIQKDQSHEDKH